jgi:hypothetical protein
MKTAADSSALFRGESIQISYAMGALLLAVYGLVVTSLMPMGTLGWPTKSLLLIFLLSPPLLCFLLVRTYTDMIEDERCSMLTEAWDHCELEFGSSDEYREAQRRIQETHPSGDKAPNEIVLDGLRHFVLRRHPRLARIFAGVRKGQDRGEVAKRLARAEIRMAGLHREAYDLPILFFAFSYLGGLLLVFPLVESLGSLLLMFPLGGSSPSGPIPAPPLRELLLADGIKVPLMVLQVGFLGGCAYAAYNLISRFLAQDIAPRLFLVSGVRLILAPLAAMILYLLSPEDAHIPFTALNLPMGLSRAAVAVYLAVGGFPFALLQTVAEDLRSRLDPLKQGLMAGKRSITVVEGITVFTAQRLGEEGIDVIQHLAFCDPADVARRTRYSESTVGDWKDQAILYLLTGDCTVPGTPAPQGKTPLTIYELLDEVAGIRSMSALLRRIWIGGTIDQRGEMDRRGGELHVRADIEAFFRELGLLSGGDETKYKQRLEDLTFLFTRLSEDALAIEPDLRRIRRDGRASASRGKFAAE